MLRPAFSRVLLLALSARVAFADPVSKQDCFDAYERAQEARQSSHFRVARKQIEICTNAACPAIARTDCTNWLGDIDRLQPSIKLAVRGPQGDIKDASVSLDGEAIASEGTIDVDPGDHQLRVEASGMRRLERKISVLVGQKAQRVEVTLERDAGGGSVPPPPPPPTTTTRPSLALPLVLGGVGLLGLGAFGYFGLSGKADEDELKKCKPICAQSSVDDVKRSYIIADVGLGVGVLALGAATYLLLSRPAAEAPRTAVSPWLTPNTSGLSVSGKF